MFGPFHRDHAMTGPAITLVVGEKLPACEITISQELIDAYASISGDFNPIHVDRQAAAASAFGGTIAHGCIPMEPVFRSEERRVGKEC